MNKLVAVLTLAFGLAMGGQVRAEPPEVIVGAPNALTGVLGESGRYVVRGLTVAVEDINRAGGIKSLGGAKIKLIPADTSSEDPKQAASVTRRLITQDHAVLLVGAHASAMTLSAQIEAERGGVPIITTSYADQITERGYRYTFKLPAKSSVFATAALDYSRKLFADAGHPLKRVAVFYGANAGDIGTGKAAIDYIKANPDLTLVATGSVPNGITDPTPIARPILETKPDLLVANFATTDMVLVMHALRALHIDIPVLTAGSAISVKSIPEALGGESNGIMGTIAWNGDLPISGVNDFVAAYLKAYSDQTFASQEAGEGYAIGQLISQALEKAASADPAKLRDTLATISAPTIMPGGPIEFDATGLNKHSIPVMVEWQDGVLHAVWPKQYQVRPLQLP